MKAQETAVNRKSCPQAKQLGHGKSQTSLLGEETRGPVASDTPADSQATSRNGRAQLTCH